MRSFFHQAQFISSLKWNAIELIIAQHLIEHGAYVTGLDYPSAITWRPVLPTLVVTFFRLCTSDPILIYQLVCGFSLGSLAASMFLSARTLWSRPAAHAAAFFVMMCPAVTMYLLQHVHSYSHLVALLFLGPAIYQGITTLQLAATSVPPSVRRAVCSGFLWGCCYLCRSELLLFGMLQIGLLGYLCLRDKRLRKPLGGCVLVVLALMVPYNSLR